MTPDKAKASWDVGYIWAFWSNKWNGDGNCSHSCTVDLRRLSCTDGDTAEAYES